MVGLGRGCGRKGKEQAVMGGNEEGKGLHAGYTPLDAR